jgi:biotin transport system ATP-binding protein
MEPAYVVMDAPTTLLDLRNKRRVARAVDAIDQTVIFVSHDLDLLHDFDRVVVFDEGRVIADDTPDKAIPLYVDRMS